MLTQFSCSDPAHSRRRFLQWLSLTLASTVHLGRAFARSQGESVPDPMASFIGAWRSVAGNIAPESVAISEALALEMPLVAEDGTLVPVKIRSELAATRALHLLVVNNPWPLIASMSFAPVMRPRASLRIRMQRDSAVILLADTATGWYQQIRQVKVLQGGCG